MKQPIYYLEKANNYLYAVYTDCYYSWSEARKDWTNQCVDWSPQGTAQVFDNPKYSYCRVHLYQVKSIFPKLKSHKRVATNSTVTD